MTMRDIDEFVKKAEEIYASQFQAELEREHMDEFVAIDPVSGEYFLGGTLNEATQAARQDLPERLTHAIRIGHRAALHFGLHVR